MPPTDKVDPTLNVPVIAEFPDTANAAKEEFPDTANAAKEEFPDTDKLLFIVANPVTDKPLFIVANPVKENPLFIVATPYTAKPLFIVANPVKDKLLVKFANPDTDNAFICELPDTFNEPKDDAKAVKAATEVVPPDTVNPLVIAAFPDTVNEANVANPTTFSVLLNVAAPVTPNVPDNVVAELLATANPALRLVRPLLTIRAPLRVDVPVIVAPADTFNALFIVVTPETDNEQPIDVTAPVTLRPF